MLGPLKHTIKDLILEDEEFIFIVKSGEERGHIYSRDMDKYDVAISALLEFKSHFVPGP